MITSLAVAAVAGSLGKESFAGHRVLRCVPRTADATVALGQIAETFPLTDWWLPPAAAGRPVDVRVSNEDTSLTRQLYATDSNCTVLIKDLQQLIDTENHPALRGGEASRGRRQANDPWTWGYHEYDEVALPMPSSQAMCCINHVATRETMQDIIRHFTEDIVPKFDRIASTFTIGKSYEGRDQVVVRISGGEHKVNSNGTAVPNANPGFWMEALIHSREWITGAAMYWVIEAILEGYGSDPTITKVVNEMDLYFLLVTNPDGYVFTLENRMWRKTRAPNAGSTCMGTDPNRNWDFHWCEVGASTNPCTDTFCGPSPASAQEVAQVQKFVGEHGNIAAFIDFHAYSQLWLTAWGYTDELPPRDDYELQQSCAKAATDALTSVHRTRYTYGPVSTTIYPAAGSSLDWAYGVHDIKLAFGPEGRDTGQYGFILPWTEIVPSGQENLAAVLATAEFALRTRESEQ